MEFNYQTASGASLAHRAYLRVREKILKGEIPMGGFISRRQLAEEFEMSPVPVAEAILRLESEGLLESRPRVGTRVKVPTPNDIRERYIFREALESQCARLFSERASDLERKSLIEMAARLDKQSQAVSTEGEQQYEFQSFHLQFHMQIAHSAGSTLLSELLEKNQLLVFNWLFDINAQSRMPRGWHSQLARIVSGVDPNAAALAMGNHIRTGMSDIQEAIARKFSVSLSPIGRRSSTGTSQGTDSQEKKKRIAKPPSQDKSKRGKNAKKRVR
jgi:DNA-binding GntR family transcriptional regulator